MTGDDPKYYAFLLRMWRTGPQGPWRASLEDAETGTRIGFGCLAEVYVYLLERATEEARPCASDGRHQKP